MNRIKHLFEKLNLPNGKKTKTGYSTDSDTLESIRYYHELPSLILEYRRLTKLYSTSKKTSMNLFLIQKEILI